MSADNAIYIYGSPEWGWRVKHYASLYPEDMGRDELDAAFTAAPSFADFIDAHLAALGMSKDYDVLEYGVQVLGRPEADSDEVQRAVAAERERWLSALRSAGVEIDYEDPPVKQPDGTEDRVVMAWDCGKAFGTVVQEPDEPSALARLLGCIVAGAESLMAK